MPDLEPLELPEGVQIPLVDRAAAQQRRNRPRPAPLVIEDGSAPPSRSASASSLVPSRSASASSLCALPCALPARPILAPKVERLTAAYDDGGSSSEGDSSEDDLDETKMLRQHDCVLKEMKTRIDKLVEDAKKAHAAGVSPRRVPPSPAPRAQQPFRKPTPRGAPKETKGSKPR
jgi:hypothetical protein